jgi:hypothetical protein
MKNPYKSEVLDLIKNKLDHFRSFRNAATLRGGEQERQFKTEKWLQAELIHYFLSKNIRAIPEYSQQRWDICVDGTLLALKCFADSAQTAHADYVGGVRRDSGKYAGVKKDLDAIAETPIGQAAFALILPLDPNDKKREKYRNEMLECVDKHPKRKNMSVEKIAFHFPENAPDGIVVVWIQRK